MTALAALVTTEGKIDLLQVDTTAILADLVNIEAKVDLLQVDTTAILAAVALVQVDTTAILADLVNVEAKIDLIQVDTTAILADLVNVEAKVDLVLVDTGAILIALGNIDADTTQLLADLAVVDGNVDGVKSMATSLFMESIKPTECIPSAADPVTCTDINDAGGTPWGNGAWVELIADIGTDDIKPASANISNAGAGEFELDIGQGAGGAEVVITTVSFTGDGQYKFSAPNITTNNVRLAARIRSKQATGLTADVKLNVVNVT